MARERWMSYPRREPVAIPVTGANFTRRNDSGGMWFVRGLTFRLTTDVAAPVRNVTLRASAGPEVWWRTSATAGQAASLARDYTAFPGSGAVTVSVLTLYLVWPTDGLWLPPGHILESVVENLDAADALSAIILDLIEYPDLGAERFAPPPYAYREVEA